MAEAKKSKKGAIRRPHKKRTVRRPRKKGTIGRPRIEFDLSHVEGLGAIMATHEEMAAVLGCSVFTIEDRMRKDAEFSGAYKRGQGTGRLRLRRTQWQAADAGNITMMIWLGKQWLDQRDKADIVTTQDHERFRAAYIRAGTQLVEGVRAGGDVNELIARFINEVRGDDSEAVAARTARDGAVEEHIN